jgi:hypothetical protein
MQTLFTIMTLGIATFIQVVLASSAQDQAEEAITDAYSFFELTSEEQSMFDSVNWTISLFKGVFVVNLLVLILEIIHILFFFRKNVKALCHDMVIPRFIKKEVPEISQI